jgi:catechol 2,3-dioxygenase-like lactoylglutathione lyase family enzyme
MEPTPIAKVRDVAWPRLRAPDLDAMEAFLLDFGMTRAARTADTLYMRGAGPAPFIHVTHRGEAAFLGFAFVAAGAEDLHRLAASEGFTPVEAIDAPGGGWRTATTDPHGLIVEVVHGVRPLPEASPPESRPLNMGANFQRLGAVQRIAPGPSRIKRFGHLALNVSNLEGTIGWYNARFGLIYSDRINLAPGFPVAAFTRCDKGEEPADHHTILFASDITSGGAPGLNHLAFEVGDFDDVLAGHEHLKGRGRAHEWGVGRHLLGSQVFDYWRDPWGHIHEHWTDGDQLPAHVPAGEHTPDVALSSQWGPSPGPTFGRTIAPAA